MSLRATMWALDHAPVTNPGEVLTLWALADEANDDGTDSCPYKDKLARRVRRSERSVQGYLRSLYQKRLIEFGDQAVAQRRYGKQPGHAPRAWNLNLDASWDNVPTPRTDEEMELYARMMSSGRPADEVQSAAPHVDGEQNLHPTDEQGKRSAGEVQNLPPEDPHAGGEQNLHPTDEQGKRQGGVQPVAPFPRGSRTKRTSSSPPPDANQETEQSIKSDAWWPILTEWENDLAAQCLTTDELWSPRMLRKVLGSYRIRELTARNPELVQRAFLLAAKDPSTTSPMRLWHTDKCPSWRVARDQIRAAAAGKGGSTPPASTDAAADPPPGQQADTARPAWRRTQPPPHVRATLASITQRRKDARAAEERAAAERRARAESAAAHHQATASAA